jgi:hypothetical protein
VILKTPISPFLDAYKEAAGEGSVIELKMRLLANKIPELQSFACAKNLKDVEAKIVCYFANELSEQDCQALRLCRQLRNKVLHCDFHAARGRLKELGVQTGDGGVQRVGIQGLSTHQIAEKIGEVASGRMNTAQAIAESSSTKDGTVYGWLLELGVAGDFTQASNAFKAAAVIIDRLMESTTIS